MKSRFALIIGSLIGCILIVFLCFQYNIRSDHQEFAVEQESESNIEGIKHAMNYLGKMRGDVTTGKVSLDNIYSARELMYASRRQNSRSSSLGLEWEELGPDNVGGRTRAIMFDKNNPDRMYAGGVSGGLFVSDNQGLSWSQHPSNSMFGHLGISAIKQASNGDIYVGTGEFFTDTEANTNASGFIGEGVYKSTDGGISFDSLPSTKPIPNTPGETWSYVTEIAIDPSSSNRIYAGARRGLKISNDGGITWADPQGLDVADISTNSVARPSREVNVGPDGTVYASINRKYYKSQDGFTYENKTGVGGFPSTGIGRIEFTVSPQDGNFVYALLSTNTFSGSEVSGSIRGVYRSQDKGETWTEIAPPSSDLFNPLGDQGKYDMCIAVDNSNKNRIFVGGQLELWSWSSTEGWNLVSNTFPRTPDNPYYIHPDMHTIVFHPTNSDIMFIGCDGGLFKSQNASQFFPTFVPRNKGYNVTQFYGIGASVSGEVMGGTQDNGTQLIDFTGNTRLNSDLVSGGDGGHAEFSKINRNALFAETIFARLERSSDYGQSFASPFDANIDPDLNGWPGNGNPLDGGSPQALFIAPFTLWENVDSNLSVLLLGTNNNLWFTPDALNFSISPRWYNVTVGGIVSAIGFSTNGVIFCGTTNGRIHRIEGIPTANLPDPENWTWSGSSTGGITRTEIPLTGSQWVCSISVDPNDSNHLITTLGNYRSSSYVYRSTNALSQSPTFTSIQGDLPSMPVYGSVISYYNSDVILVGTELGIWATNNAGTNWTEENVGMVSVPTFMLRQEMLYNSDCQVIYAGTHGRGIFRTTSLTPTNCNLIAGSDQIPANSFKFHVYPNPIYDVGIIEYDLKQSLELELNIYDLMGRSIQKDYLMGDLGRNNSKLDFQDIPGGVYIIKINSTKSENQIEASRIVFVTK